MSNKNIWLSPTYKLSKLAYYQESTSYNEPVLQIVEHTSSDYKYQNIHITNDEKPKDGDWVIDIYGKIVNKFEHYSNEHFYKKIILTTDIELIESGVQVIDDELLEWFIKNPSCEFVKTEKWLDDEGGVFYSRIIPKEKIDHSNLLKQKEAEFKETQEPYKQIILKEEPFNSKKGLKEEPNYNMKEEIIAEMERIEEPKQEKFERKGSKYFKANAEEDYAKVPISVLRYISELEKEIEELKSK